MKLLIRQGRLVDPVGGIGGIMDVLVEDGKVAVIGSNINEPDARVIDAPWTDRVRRAGGYACTSAGARL